MPKFFVNYTFHASASDLIDADSEEEARRIIEARVEDDAFDLDAETIDDVDFTITEMKPITRDGRKIWSGYVRDTDTLGHEPSA